MSKKKLYLKDVRKAVKETVQVVLVDQVIAAYRTSPLARLQLIPTDSMYWVLPTETWQLILDYSQVDKIKYLPERQDCDDFARIIDGEIKRKLLINSSGLVVDWSGGHAYSVLVAIDDGKISLVGVEPQSDQWAVSETGLAAYSMQTGFVLL